MPQTNDEQAFSIEFGANYDKSGKGTWGGDSGPGSDPYYTMPYRAFLESFIRLNRIGSVVDVGCGDWKFSRYLDFSGVAYRGYDVVPELIERNRAAYGTASVRFDLMPNDIDAVPGAQLLVMKDVLQHLPTDTILEMRDRLFGKFDFCLITNSFEKLDTPQNSDIEVGGFRCLDLRAEPFGVDGSYVLEFGSPLWERIRTILHQPSRVPRASKQPASHRQATDNLLLLQTADPFVYSEMLSLTSAINIKFCQTRGFNYESYVGIKNGAAPWMASYNRIYMLDELIQRGYRGWTIFADADSFVSDFSFDIIEYLKNNREYCLIGATGGSDAPWNLNSGILFINLGDPLGRAFPADWLERFLAEVPQSYLDNSRSEWDEFPNDQALMYECIKYVPGLMAKTKREDQPIFNYHNGQFMKQALRAGHDNMAGRLEWIKTTSAGIEGYAF
jgi:SAM-dependent methyltransferase